MAEDYRTEMKANISAADAAAEELVEVNVKVSRQNYTDLVEAYRFLRQINPEKKAVGERLEKLAIRIRDALDQRPEPRSQ